MVIDNLKRAFYEDEDIFRSMNTSPKPCGQFKKLPKHIFENFVAPVAKYYRKSDFYNSDLEVLLKIEYGLFRSFVNIGLMYDDYDIMYSINKKAKERDIDEYAYKIVSNFRDEMIRRNIV